MRERQEPAPDVPRARHRGRKDTVHWCRGKVGVEHQLVIRYNKNLRRLCQPRPYWMDHRPLGQKPKKDPEFGYRKWWCNHQLACAQCGKIIEDWIEPAQCPVWEDPNGVKLTEAIIFEYALDGDPLPLE